MSLKELQKEIFENKIRHGFNTTDLREEFCHLYGEVAEAHDAWYKNLDTFPEELADVAIFLLGIAEIKGVDIEKEILKYNKFNIFNATNLNEEFCRLYGKITEAYDAWEKNLDSFFPEKLADVAIHLFRIAEIKDVNLKQEIIKKVEKNKHRKYVKNDIGNFVKAEGET